MDVTTSQESHPLTRCCSVYAQRPRRKWSSGHLGGRNSGPRLPQVIVRMSLCLLPVAHPRPLLPSAGRGSDRARLSGRPLCPAHPCRAPFLGAGAVTCCRRTIQKRTLESLLTVLFSSYSFLVHIQYVRKRCPSPSPDKDGKEWGWPLATARFLSCSLFRRLIGVHQGLLVHF